jgi:hypothetical protein
MLLLGLTTQLQAKHPRVSRFYFVPTRTYAPFYQTYRPGYYWYPRYQTYPIYPVYGRVIITRSRRSTNRSPTGGSHYFGNPHASQYFGNPHASQSLGR